MHTSYSKLIKDLNIRPETIEILEENMAICSWILILVIFSCYVSQARKSKAKINKWGYVKHKNLCTKIKLSTKLKDHLHPSHQN